MTRKLNTQTYIHSYGRAHTCTNQIHLLWKKNLLYTQLCIVNKNSNFKDYFLVNLECIKILK